MPPRRNKTTPKAVVPPSPPPAPRRRVRVQYVVLSSLRGLVSPLSGLPQPCQRSHGQRSSLRRRQMPISCSSTCNIFSDLGSCSHALHSGPRPAGMALSSTRVKRAYFFEHLYSTLADISLQQGSRCCRLGRRGRASYPDARPKEEEDQGRSPQLVC